MGYLVYAVIFAIILCLVLLVLHYIGFGKAKAEPMQLKITIPESLNFQSLFDEILKNYTESYRLKQVKMSDFGTMFLLVYHITLKSGINQKQLFDELRCRNGNQNISLTLKENETAPQ
jgi:hypothetical protein